MLRLLSRLIRVLRRPGGRAQAPVLRRTRKPTVICVGCVEDYAMLDRVLEPGAYDISFLDSIEGAYARIAAARPSRVIFCMRADDARSLHVLSMLHLDPRTNRIPILTCIPSISDLVEVGEHTNGGGLSAVPPGVVTH